METVITPSGRIAIFNAALLNRSTVVVEIDPLRLVVNMEGWGDHFVLRTGFPDKDPNSESLVGRNFSVSVQGTLLYLNEVWGPGPEFRAIPFYSIEQPERNHEQARLLLDEALKEVDAQIRRGGIRKY